MAKFNGWKNWETWNVALWITGGEGLYHSFKDARRTCRTRALYRHCVEYLGLSDLKTADGAPFLSRKLSYRELNSLIAEL